MVARKILGILVPSMVLFYGLFFILEFKDYYRSIGGAFSSGSFGLGLYLIIYIMIGVLTMAFAIAGILMFSISRKPRTGKMYYLNLSWVKYGGVFAVFLVMFLMPLSTNIAQYGQYVQSMFKTWQYPVYLVSGVVFIVIFSIGRKLRKRHKLAAAIVNTVGAGIWIIMSGVCSAFVFLQANDAMGWGAYIFGAAALLCHSALQFVEFGCNIRIAEKKPAGQKAEPKPLPKPKPKPEYVPED